MLALDARVVVYGAEVNESELPELAIRPYPSQYVDQWNSRQGLPVTIRPIRPEDEPLMVNFHARLSDRSVYLRYLHPMQLTQRVAHERLARICFIDYAREMALVAEANVPPAGDGQGTTERAIIAVGRLSKEAGGNEQAEFAILVADDFQGHGLGTELLRRLVEVGRDEGLGRIVGYISPENTPMQSIVKKLGFKLKRLPDEDILEAVLVL
jgi:acetyltransferase